jgi:hypothetical protein
MMSGKRYATVEEQVEFAVAKISDDEMIQVRARDLMFVYQTLRELQRFFHQPLHWPTLQSVQTFIGDKDKGALHLLSQCYHQKLRDVWTPKIVAQLEDGELDHPDPPYYYEPDPS